jgi:predicted Zn-dependent protease
MSKVKWLLFLAMVGLVILANTAYAAPTPSGKAAFDRLINLSQIKKVDKRVHIEVADVPGSYTNGRGDIYIAKADIALCGRELNCIAFIAAHELGHNVLGHVRGNDYTNIMQEMDSDVYAIQLTKEAGLNPCAGAAFFKKIISIWGDSGGNTHPRHSQRVKYMEEMCQKDNIPLPPAPWKPHLKVYTKDYMR